MKSLFGLRLWFLIGALLAVAGGIIYGLSSAWQHVQQLESDLTSSRVESFRIAGEVERGLLNLHNSMLRFVMVRDPHQWALFEKASGDLDRWIDRHDPTLNSNSSLTTESERHWFSELNRAYDDYLRSARAVHSNNVTALV